jgi:hypothetical protein
MNLEDCDGNPIAFLFPLRPTPTTATLPIEEVDAMLRDLWRGIPSRTIEEMAEGDDPDPS